MDNSESALNDYSNKLREQVTQFLITENWRVGSPIVKEGTQWILTANDGVGRPITIIYPTSPLKQSGQLVVATGLALGDEHKARYAGLEDNEKSGLIFELRHQILLLGVNYDGFSDPLTMMTFEDILYTQDLSKSSFLQSVRKVRNAALLATTIIAQRFNEPPPPEPEKPHIGFIKH